jgi:RNA polymerase sigma-70 factor, ECF subfamily
MERFSLLFEQHGRAIYSHIRALVPNASDADEVFQEASITLWQKFDQYRPDTDFRAWACRIAYYKVLKLRDRQVRSPRLFSPQFLDLVSEEMIVMSDMLDARTEALLLCRDKLDARDRDLLDRFHRHGATAKEVAHWLGRNVHYVYRAIRRIHETLFECINRVVSKDRDR